MAWTTQKRQADMDRRAPEIVRLVDTPLHDYRLKKYAKIQSIIVDLWLLELTSQ